MTGWLTPGVMVSADLVAPSWQSDNRPTKQLQYAGDSEVSVRVPALESAPTLTVYPLTRLGDYKLAQSIVVTVEPDDNGVIMNSPKLRLWGAGADVYEASADFAATFFDVLESYRQTNADELTPSAVEYRKQLESYLV